MVSLVTSMTEDHPAEPVLVLSNDPNAGGLARARELAVPVAVVDHRNFAAREAFDLAVSERLEAANADVVCLAGFMRILTPAFVAKWAGRVLNIHPSLLPAYKGLHTHARALAAGEVQHGCTVHEVTSELDDGPILGQARLTIDQGDTPDSLAAKVLQLEHRLYPAVLRRFAAGDRTPIQMT